MGAIRNGFVAVAVTAALIGGLFVLFPEPARAVQVHLTGGGVETPAADGSFNVTFQMSIPDPEHVGIDYARVVVHGAGATLDADGDLTGALVCDATTGGSPGATILSITGAAAANANYLGYGYDVQASGSGYAFVNQQVAINTGYGTGYGGGNSVADNLVVKVRVTGCSPVYATNPLPLRIQGYLGTASVLFRSFPVNVNFADPSSVTTTTPVSTTTTDVTTTSAGGQTSTDITISAVGGDSVATNTQIVIPFAGSEGVEQITIVPNTPLPTGSRIVATVLSPETGGAPSRTSPPLGINPAALQSQTPVDPALFLDLNLFVPGEGSVNPATYLDHVDVEVDVPVAFFLANGIPAQRFAVRGFTDAGELKVTHPQIIRVLGGPPSANYEITFRIRTFSSFAGISGPGLGGGGGGGGADATPTPTPSVTPSPSVSVTPLPSVDPSSVPSPTVLPTVLPTDGPTASPSPSIEADVDEPGVSRGMVWGIVIGVVVLVGAAGIGLAMFFRKP